MTTRNIEPAHRAISIVALIQVGVIVAGILWVATWLKAYGYGLHDVTLGNRFFRTDAIFVRHYGVVLFFIPISWVVLALIVDRFARRTWVALAMLAAGIAGALGGIWYFLVLGIRAGYTYFG